MHFIEFCTYSTEVNYLALNQDSCFPFTLSHSFCPTSSHVNMYIHVIVYMYIIYGKYKFPLTLLDLLRPKFQMLLFPRLHCLLSLGNLSILVLYLRNKNYSGDFSYITKSNHENHEFIWNHRNWILLFFSTCHWSSKHLSCLINIVNLCSFTMHHLKARIRYKEGKFVILPNQL